MNIASPSRPVILTFLRHYLPGYKAGGPLRTISNMVELLGDEFDFRIVTSDRDATDTAPYAGIQYCEWMQIGKARIRYLPPKGKNLRQIAEIMRSVPHDTLYLNSFFDPDFTIKPLMARRLGLAPRTRCVIAPRGEFAPAALRLKALKKGTFRRLASRIGLYENALWQASSAGEEADIRRIQGLSAREVRIAINLPDMAVHAPSIITGRRKDDPLRICFLSRISQMKNLHYAIEVLRDVAVPVQFDIYGPVRDETYWAQCRKLLAALPENIKFTCHGGIEHERVASTIARYDLFFLPTLGENFGHAILDALSAGTPVLISNKTPWRALSSHGIGWDLPLERPDAFVVRIHMFARLAQSEIDTMRKNAALFARRHKSDRRAIEENRRLFL